MRWFNVKVIAADREKERAQLESKPDVCIWRKSEVPALADISTPPAVKGDAIIFLLEIGYES